MKSQAARCAVELAELSTLRLKAVSATKESDKLRQQLENLKKALAFSDSTIASLKAKLPADVPPPDGPISEPAPDSSNRWEGVIVEEAHVAVEEDQMMTPQRRSPSPTPRGPVADSPLRRLLMSSPSKEEKKHKRARLLSEV
jgi:hypothetical protein